MNVVSMKRAALSLGGRTLWQDISLDIAAGEFIAVLGPNGAGKTSLLRVLLGLQALTSGSVTVNGREPRRGSPEVGYVPQHKGFARDIPLRGVDLVRLGLDGHLWGPRRGTAEKRERVAAAIASVGATSYAGRPLGQLSGGEQQRLRIAQALLSDPKLLLCDEPLLSLDLQHQQAVITLIDERRRASSTAVVLVTHEINPVLPYVDRVLYVVAGRWAIGTPDEIMTTESLSELYNAPIDVIRHRGRIIVVGTSDASDVVALGGHHEHSHHEHSHHDHLHGEQS